MLGSWEGEEEFVPVEFYRQFITPTIISVTRGIENPFALQI